MLEIGDTVLDGTTVVVSVTDDGDTRVEFPSWKDPVNRQPFAITYSPGTTLRFVTVQVEAILRGEVPPFVGL